MIGENLDPRSLYLENSNRNFNIVKFKNRIKNNLFEANESSLQANTISYHF